MSNQVATAKVDLSGLLTVRGVAGGREVILKALASSEDVSLDIPAGCDADVAGIQLIRSALLQSRIASKRLTLSSPASGAILDILNRGGFTEAMSPEDRQFWLHDGLHK